MTLDFKSIRHNPVTLSEKGLVLGNLTLAPGDWLETAQASVKVTGAQLLEASRSFQAFLGNARLPQLALLVYNLTGDDQALEQYIPLLKVLSPEEKDRFLKKLAWVSTHPNFRVRYFTAGKKDRTLWLPFCIRQLLAGLILEPLFFRPDLLERFFSRRRRFRLYDSPDALKQDGGVGGGDYNPRAGGLMQLVVTRLWEGFDQPIPGVSPFLHEFGHMLDAFNPQTGRLGRLDGYLPGMSADARQLFDQGKFIELNRYTRWQQHGPLGDEEQPIGHPYVFQNDREFLAGYFEMFFRNPNHFASRNPTLFQAFVETLGHDPRRQFPKDFAFYITANRETYRKQGPNISPPGLFI